MIKKAWKHVSPVRYYRELSRLSVFDVAIGVLVLFMVVYSLATTHVIFQTLERDANLHLGCALVVIFLARMKGGKFPKFALAGVILAVASTAWIHYYSADLVLRGNIFLTAGDVVIGILLVLLVLEGTRQFVGPQLVVITMVAVAYAFTAVYIPGRWGIPYLSPDVILGELALNFTGLNGRLLGLSQSYIFLFIVFGGLLGAIGGTDFFVEAGKAVAGRIRGGMAVSSAVGSSLVGMLSGSTGANIVITGSFTIPAMKKAGFTPEEAAGIEAASSAGGHMMPPVMASIGFIIAAFIGIPYREVMIAAFIPSALYYLGIAVTAQRTAERRFIAPMEGKLDVRKLLISSPFFFVPLLTLASLLVLGYSPKYAIFWGLVGIVAIALTRWSARQVIAIFRGVIQGAVLGASVAVLLASLGLIIRSFDLTGLTIQLGRIMGAWAAGSVMLGAVVAMAMALLLGAGAHVTGSYIVVALVLGPVLVDLGMTPLAAHLLIAYYACYGVITPPVGFGALLASRLAGAGYVRSGLQAMKMGIAGLVVPLIFIFSEPLLLRFGNVPYGLGALHMILAFLIIVFLGCLLSGYYLRKLNFLQGAAMGVGVILVYSYFPTQNLMMMFVGCALLAAVTLWQLRERRKGGNIIQNAISR